MTHYSPVVAALVTMLLTLILLVSKTGRLVQDVPNERSLHTIPVPRIGGLGMMGGICAAWAFMPGALFWWVVVPMLLLVAVSWLDDLRGLPVRTRLLGQMMAALVTLVGSGFAWQHPVLFPVLLLAIVWMTNLYNFMDGSDGLAGGMAFFGFTAYGVAALMAGGEAHAMLNFSIGAAALGFLYYNFHPARIFMGDSGSIPLGFLAAVMGMVGWQQSLWPFWFPLIVFSPFIVDATVTLARRSLRGAKVTEAHREHYYQRLVQSGWGHRKVAFAEYGLMFLSGTLAVWASAAPVFPWMAVAALAGLYVLLMWAVDARWQEFRRDQTN
ncbi:glycosyltransferase family 4 protein [Ferriphaselus sp. R-1]|uniref:MraY family glycosyltransferase n=1 Tax=Ferriphaselus sp. R-1 TaxID=1485544 RepID=UPI000554818B|nr:glycosyltransferase family 4 protein [Ferriphaselus sp. R-1]